MLQARSYSPRRAWLLRAGAYSALLLPREAVTNQSIALTGSLPITSNPMPRAAGDYLNYVIKDRCPQEPLDSWAPLSGYTGVVPAKPEIITDLLNYARLTGAYTHATLGDPIIFYPGEVVTSVSFNCPLIGKQKYTNTYGIHPGDHFDAQKHAQGIKNITKNLTQDGYLNPQIYAHVGSGRNRAIVITINPGPRSIIEEVIVIVTEDNETIRQDIQRLLERTLAGRTLTNDLINQSAKTAHDWLRKKGFCTPSIAVEYTARTNTHRAQVHYTITLGNKKELVYIGNVSLTAQKLDERISQISGSFSHMPPPLIAEEIRTYYYQHGFWQAQVTAQDSPERLELHITEGTQTVLERVTCVGVTAYDHRDYARFFAPICAPAPFDHKKLQQCCDQFIERYLKDGYWDAHIDSTEYTELSPYRYALIIHLTEGTQRILAEIDCTKLPEAVRERCIRDLAQQVHVGIPIDIEALSRMRQLIMRELTNAGYLYSNATPEIRTADHGAVTITWHLTELSPTELSATELSPTEMLGKENLGAVPVRFGTTVIASPTTLPINYMTRELAYQTGDIWDRKKIDLTVARLKQLSIFSSVSLTGDAMQHPASRKDLILRCVLDKPHEVRIRGGAQVISKNFSLRGGFSPTGGLSILWKNPTNRADLITASADVNRYMREVTLTYELPWLGSLPIRSQYSVYSMSYRQPIVIGSSEILYRVEQNGLMNAFKTRPKGTQLSGIEAGLNIGFEWMRISQISRALARVINFEPSLVRKQVPFWYMEPTLFFDFLDNKVYPRNGFFALISGKTMVPLTTKSTPSIKVIAEYSLFKTLYRELIGAIRLRLGAIFQDHFTEIMPSERFYLGGAFSLRGYDPDLAPPLNIFKNCAGELRYAPTGGNAVAHGNLELRFPLYKTVGGVIFTDFGKLSQKGIAAVPSCRLLGSVGFGLRWHTPVGPLRFDIGWKLHNEPHGAEYPKTARYAWYLTIGNAF